MPSSSQPETLHSHTKNSGTMHFSFILRCWITANGGLRGYLVELPSRLKHPFTEEEELVETVYRLTTTDSSARDTSEEQ